MRVQQALHEGFPSDVQARAKQDPRAVSHSSPEAHAEAQDSEQDHLQPECPVLSGRVRIRRRAAQKAQTGSCRS